MTKNQIKSTKESIKKIGFFFKILNKIEKNELAILGVIRSLFKGSTIC